MAGNMEQFGQPNNIMIDGFIVNSADEKDVEVFEAGYFQLVCGVNQIEKRVLVIVYPGYQVKLNHDR
jgi:hypothetical protein